MTDRELLELAAKAVGHIGFSGDDYQGPYFCIPSDPAIPRSEPQIFRWLTDDGDALRLAVRLDLHIKFYRKHVDVDTDVRLGDIFSESFTADKEAATRRAIVLAAAEIGKTLGE